MKASQEALAIQSDSEKIIDGFWITISLSIHRCIKPDFKLFNVLIFLSCFFFLPTKTNKCLFYYYINNFVNILFKFCLILCRI